MAKYQSAKLDKQWRAERRTGEAVPKWKLTRTVRNAFDADVRYWELRKEMDAARIRMEEMQAELARLKAKA